MSNAESSFNSFYHKFKEEKYPFYTTLFNLLPNFVAEVSEEWGYGEISIDCVSATNDKINESKALFQFETQENKIIVITEDGKCYLVKLNHEATGETTWNGDGEYFPSYRSWYSDHVEVDVIENIKDMNESTELTIELLEQTGAEIVSALLQ